MDAARDSAVPHHVAGADAGPGELRGRARRCVADDALRYGGRAGIGQALEQEPGFPYYLFRNEQAMVHAAAAFAKTTFRKRTLVCTSSIGPGATNMITGAALATINRLPVLLLPGDTFARRNVAPVLQQLESPLTQDVSVNDCFKPVSNYWDRIERPEQLLTSLAEAMRVLTSPSQTGAVTLSLPQDVQAEALDVPDVIEATLIELALDKLLNWAGKPPGHVF